MKISMNTVTAEAHDKLHDYLVEMLETGLYGHDLADVALRLVERGVREAIEQRVIKGAT